MDWILKNFWIPEDNFITGEPGPRPIDLQPYQIDCLREALRRDENGDFVYSTIIWSDIKKSAKSTVAAAVMLWMANLKDWSEIYCVANDLRQADTRVGKYIRRAISYSPTLKGKWRAVGYSVRGQNNSIIDSIPIDPEGEAGSNADAIQFSELWGAQDEAKARMWSELTLSPTKHGQSFRWVESYAGFAEESLTLYELYRTGVMDGQLIWPDRLYPVTAGEPSPLEAYANPNARMFCLWNTQPRCPWQTPSYYQAEAAVLLPNEFLRMHRNQWVHNVDTFVPIEWWDACQRPDEEWPAFDKKRHPFVISLDAAVSNDTFGVLMSGRHPTLPTDTIVEYSRKWEPPAGGKIDYNDPMAEVDRLINEYNVVQVCYDPYQLHDFATRMKRKGRVWMKSFNQGNDRLIADSQLRDMIRERRIWHRGDPDLRSHLLNADAKIDNEDRKVRIVKRRDHLKIDLAICLSMSTSEVMRLNL